MEKFKPIKDFPGYEVSDHGTIRSLDRLGTDGRRIKGIELAPRYSRSGYARCSLRKNGASHDRYVHRLVAEHFVHNVHKKLEVNHIDCEKINNFANNLEWVTRQEQMAHAGAEGLLGPFKRQL